MAAVSISEAMAPPCMVVPIVMSELAKGSVSVATSGCISVNWIPRCPAKGDVGRNWRMISARVCDVLPGMIIISSLLLFDKRVLSRYLYERHQRTLLVIHSKQNWSGHKSHFYIPIYLHEADREWVTSTLQGLLVMMMLMMRMIVTIRTGRCASLSTPRFTRMPA